MLDRDVGLARPQPEYAADEPAAREIRVEHRDYCKGAVARSRNGDTGCRTPKRRDRGALGQGRFRAADLNSSPPAMVISEAVRKTVLSEIGPVSPTAAGRPVPPTGRRSFGTRVIQWPQNLLSERTWEFKSPRPHQ